MSTHNDTSQEELDDAINRNLREAYKQVQFREEWAELVLHKVASESEQQDVIAKNSTRDARRRRILALAASILLAALGVYKLIFPATPLKPTDSVVSQTATQAVIPSVKQAKLLEDTMRLAVELQPSETVTGESGYLAARLSEAPEFEIYMVLPTNSVSKF